MLCRTGLRSLFAAMLLLVLSMAVTVVSYAQSGYGSVRGTVRDATGAVIPNATLRLTNTATGVEHQSTSNESGLYVFPAVLAGPYRLDADSSGMAKFEGNLTVRVQQSETVDIALQPATTQTVVNVGDVTPMVIVDSPSLGQTLERRRIEQLPINGRNVMNLLYTVPGLTFDTDGGLRTAGTRVGTHDVILDGAAMTDALYGGGSVSRPPSLESIQEFKVENNSSSAKYTRQTSIIMVTRSGTNELHGSLFATNRNASIGVARARDNFTNRAAHYVRNEYGGSVGGPVVLPKIYDGRNRTFWFTAYEGFKQRQGNIGGFRVPTEAMRNGDFSGLTLADGTPITIYNPFATDPVTHSRPQFSYGGVPNRIDPALKSPLWKYFESVLPLPNRPDVNPLVGNNYFAPQPDIWNQWTWSARFDHRLTDNDNVYVRMTKADSNRFRISNGVPTLDQIGNSRNDIAPNKSMSVNWTHTFSPTLFNEILFSASRSFSSTATGDYSTRYSTDLGLPNPNNQIGFPVINDIGVGTGISNYFQPVNANTAYFNYFILDDNATKIVGKHELQFGMHLRYDQLTYLPQQQQSGGSISFPAVATALYDPTVPQRTRGTLNTGYVGASAFLGLANYTYRVVKGKYYMRQHEDALYFQDNWKVNSRLTVNLGLRWQFSPYPKDKYNIFSGFDPASKSIVLAQDLDVLYRVGATSPNLINALTGFGAKFAKPEDVGLPSGLVKNNWFDIGPHVGFAWRAGDGAKSFVLRGGFSTSYFPLPIYGWNDRMRINAPFTAIYQSFPLTAANQSPDGIPNYGLWDVGQLRAGQNSANAINLNNPSGLTIGGDSFQAAYFNPKQPSSRIHDWNLTIEKEVLPDTVLRLSYIGNHAAYQDSYDNYNQTIPDYVWYETRREPLPTGTRASALRRPFADQPYGDLQEYRKDGWGNSNGAIIGIERRYSKGLGFQFFYQLTNTFRAAGHGWYADSSVQPVTSFLPGQVPEDRRERMELLLYMRDITIPKHEFRFNWVADLPFGRGKLLGNTSNGFVDAIIGGWQVSGLGRVRSNYFTLPTNIWPTGNEVEYYGHKYPIEDCRSGECRPGYLMWNGYIPAHQINTPRGIKGVPDNYKPAAQPLFPYPADYLSRSRATDPNYGYYGTNTTFIPLNNGVVQEVAYAPLHPWINQFVESTRLWTVDASMFKSFGLGEKMRLRVQADFFNVFNTPGNEFNAGADGIVSTFGQRNTPRQLQLSGRLTW